MRKLFQGLRIRYRLIGACSSGEIERLRQLHGEMDIAVLTAYGWGDLAERATALFVEQEADEDELPKSRFDWPADFKDEVLARLLDLNAERAAAERVSGLVVSDEEDDDELEEIED